MKPIVKRKTNPAFKRLQPLPLLPNLSSRVVEFNQYAVAPAMVIVSSQLVAPALAQPS